MAGAVLAGIERIVWGTYDDDGLIHSFKFNWKPLPATLLAEKAGAIGLSWLGSTGFGLGGCLRRLRAFSFKFGGLSVDKPPQQLPSWERNPDFRAKP